MPRTTTRTRNVPQQEHATYHGKRKHDAKSQYHQRCDGIVLVRVTNTGVGTKESSLVWRHESTKTHNRYPNWNTATSVLLIINLESHDNVIVIVIRQYIRWCTRETFTMRTSCNVIGRILWNRNAIRTLSLQGMTVNDIQFTHRSHHVECTSRIAWASADLITYSRTNCWR